MHKAVPLGRSARGALSAISTWRSGEKADGAGDDAGAQRGARASRKGLESLGRRRFLTLGGHRRIFALTSLDYLRCSGPPLENGIDELR